MSVCSLNFYDANDTTITVVFLREALHAVSRLLLASMMYLWSVVIDRSVVLLEYNVYVNYWKNASSILQQMRITNASDQSSSINSVAVCT